MPVHRWTEEHGLEVILKIKPELVTQRAGVVMQPEKS